MDNLIIATARNILISRLREGTTALSSSDQVEQFLLHKLILEEREVFGVLWLDVKNRLIAVDDIALGTISNVVVFPREVLKSALTHNAANGIFYHNHPSGDAVPSSADKAMTLELKQILKFVGVNLIDHIIVAGRKSLSMARHFPF